MYTKNENIVARRIHNMNFLIDITQNYSDEKSSLYEINDIGMFIWNRIDGDADTSAITADLISQINGDVPFDVVHNDVCEFIKVLIYEGFIIEGCDKV